MKTSSRGQKLVNLWVDLLNAISNHRVSSGVPFVCSILGILVPEGQFYSRNPSLLGDGSDYGTVCRRTIEKGSKPGQRNLVRDY